jgi:RHS repeat-associated protein
VHTDHLGSPELITDSAGAQVVKLSFGAYGERRDSDWDGAVGSADQTTIGNTWRGGFTGHEHLDSVGLIHMNGRVYDPVVARFLSRDPFIDGVDSSQGPNGYAYVHNNPLNRIDPSGFVNYCAVDIPCRTINPDDPFYEFGMDQFERDYVSERSAQNRPRDDSISLENLLPPSFVSFANYVQRPLAVFTGLMNSGAGSTVDGFANDGVMNPIYVPQGTVTMGLPQFVYQQCAMSMCHGNTDLPFTHGYLTDEQSQSLAFEAGTLILGWPLGGGARVIPKVANPKLANLVTDLYKGARGPKPIGTGSTADAIRHELATGLPTHGYYHSDKGRQYINALNNWLRKNPNADYYDRVVAESLRMDLEAALQGL